MKRKSIFAFSFMCFTLGKKRKTIKRKSIFAFSFMRFTLGKNEKR